MDVSKCLFCGCLKKHGDRCLVQICTFPVQEKIKDAAKELGDHGLLTKVLGNDLIALEVKYHKNCLAEIMTKAKRRESRPSNEEVKPLYLIKLLINLYLKSKLTSSKVQHSVPVFFCDDIK